MKKVLIIGCGYLGSHLANYYCLQGWAVKIAGRKSIHVNQLHVDVEFYEIDIKDANQLNNLVEKDDVVICATGSINATNVFEDVTGDINDFYISFINLLNECANKKVSKFVFLSSAGTVYGDNLSPARETDCLNPVNIYGLQKVYFENLIKIKQYESKQLPYLILRVSNPYGGFQNPRKNQGIIPVLISRAIRKEEFIFWGDVNSVRDFIYIDDFLEATYLTVEAQVDEVINIASGISTSIKQVIEIVQNEVGIDIQIIYKKSNNRIVLNNRLDNSKLKELIGYTPATTLSQGISTIVSNY
ncbi:NAD-dependent epimerase/dehydratase family protein [Paenibacillus albidus]|uniref:NAD-dependent epimerase/dehydratase family protein n=1 Tax=Paenibacillus albidus TaxID=2041023 RepID=UPI001BE8270D|nr:NAD-dependent epimerase/dehydratase family protein [Paenibacillus albidus]MBT2290226.1 NAD-dependent epimerase/dehydratase family protein [Paenibacillus albidus]